MKKSMPIVLLALAALAPLFSAQAAPGDVGVVLLHGKWGSPTSMQPLARAQERRKRPGSALWRTLTCPQPSSTP